jgi:hypothetical protein
MLWDTSLTYAYEVSLAKFLPHEMLRYLEMLKVTGM